jgi:hypothetical protein
MQLGNLLDRHKDFSALDAVLLARVISVELKSQVQTLYGQYISYAVGISELVEFYCNVQNIQQSTVDRFHIHVLIKMA